MQSEFEVNVSISKFKIAFKIYLQEHSLKLKYTKYEYSIPVLQYCFIIICISLYCISIYRLFC